MLSGNEQRNGYKNGCLNGYCLSKENKVAMSSVELNND